MFDWFRKKNKKSEKQESQAVASTVAESEDDLLSAEQNSGIENTENIHSGERSLDKQQQPEPEVDAAVENIFSSTEIYTLNESESSKEQQEADDSELPQLSEYLNDDDKEVKDIEINVYDSESPSVLFESMTESVSEDEPVSNIDLGSLQEDNRPEEKTTNDSASKKGFLARFLKKSSDTTGQPQDIRESEIDLSDSAGEPVFKDETNESLETVTSEIFLEEVQADDSNNDVADESDMQHPQTEKTSGDLAVEDNVDISIVASNEDGSEVDDNLDEILEDSAPAEDLNQLEASDEIPESEVDTVDSAKSVKGFFARFREKLSNTRNRIAGRIESLLSSVREIDDDLLDELEELLITADLGTKTTTDLLFKIRGQVAKKELKDPAALKEALKKRIGEMVDLPQPAIPDVKPLVIMVVGINGVGKTTTIAKLTKRIQESGKNVLLAAGDTFRSAAVEQLTIWSERLGADIVSQPTGADPSAVVFDALSAAQARGSDVVIIDTAGRLHTKVNLMDELKKIKRVAGKAMPGAPHHTILVLDGNTGQNALRQAQTFNEAVGVDSIIITKLDGTAKGGVIVSIANELKIPITYIGLGESFEDLQKFDAAAFTEAIVGE